MLHRLSWGIFVVIGGLGLLASLGPLFAPSDLSMLRLMGHDPAPLEAPEAQAFTVFLARWIGTTMLGGNLFTIGIAFTALRRGELWATCLMAYWPAMFLAHYLSYGPGPMRLVQLGWLAISTAALAYLVRRALTAAPDPEAA